MSSAQCMAVDIRLEEGEACSAKREPPRSAVEQSGVTHNHHVQLGGMCEAANVPSMPWITSVAAATAMQMPAATPATAGVGRRRRLKELSLNTGAFIADNALAPLTPSCASTPTPCRNFAGGSRVQRRLAVSLRWHDLPHQLIRETREKNPHNRRDDRAAKGLQAVAPPKGKKDPSCEHHGVDQACGNSRVEESLIRFGHGPVFCSITSCLH